MTSDKKKPGVPEMPPVKPPKRDPAEELAILRGRLRECRQVRAGLAEKCARLISAAMYEGAGPKMRAAIDEGMPEVPVPELVGKIDSDMKSHVYWNRDPAGIPVGTKLYIGPPESEAISEEWIDKIMAQAQVFASAWSLIYGPFDDGNALENAVQERQRLRSMLATVPAAVPELESFIRAWASDQSMPQIFRDRANELLAAAPAPAEPKDDPQGLRHCTHPDCGRFYDHNARRQSCRAMADGACAAPQFAEPVKSLYPDWDHCQSVANKFPVDAALADFAGDPTGDNAVCLVQAVLDADRAPAFDKNGDPIDTKTRGQE